MSIYVERPDVEKKNSYYSSKGSMGIYAQKI